MLHVSYLEALQHAAALTGDDAVEVYVCKYCASPYFPDDYGRGGKFPYSMRHVAEDYLWPAAKAAGLGERIGWRTFRRTYSSLLRKLGVDIKVQQELMRHADIRTTLNLYTEPFSEDVRRANGNVVQMVLKDAAVS